MTHTLRTTPFPRWPAFAATLGLAVALAGVAPAPAEAKGCIKGAVVGGVAGHYAGHGVLGAVGGCVVGRRMARQRAAQAQPDTGRQQQAPSGYTGNSYQSNRYSGRLDAPDANPGAGYTGGAYQRRGP